MADKASKAKKENYTYEVAKQDDSKVRLNVKVKADFFKEEKEAAYKRLKDAVEIKGFRPGKGPRNLIEAKLGAKLFEETINQIFPKVTIEILKKEKLNPLTQLQYHLEKVSDADGLEYHVEFESMPEIKLPDFSKFKVTKEKVEVTKEEVTKVIEDMFARSQKAPAAKDEKGKKTEKKTEKKTAKPDDKWASTLGIPNVKVMDDLELEVEKQVKNQKETQAEEKYKAELIDQAVEKAGIKPPASLVARELESREKNYKQRIENIGLKFEDFLKNKKISMDELKKDWENDAKKRICREILLIEVAKKNDFRVTKEEIEKEIGVIQDPATKAQYDNERGRNYIATVLIQQKAINWITGQTNKSK